MNRFSEVGPLFSRALVSLQLSNAKFLVTFAYERKTWPPSFDFRTLLGKAHFKALAVGDNPALYRVARKLEDLLE
jgi:hypothetical protein